MRIFKLLPNWVDDPQGEAVLKLLNIAFREEDYQSPGATEVLLSCCFPSYCNINPTSLQSLEGDTFDAVIKVLDLNHKGIYAHQVITNGAEIFNLLKKVFLQTNQRTSSISHYSTMLQTTRH